MSIAIVGDLHIAPKPINRIDDYFNVILHKIEQISENCDKVIFLGDIFSKPKIDESFVNSLIKHLTYLKGKYNTTFYSIVGNHDVLSEDEINLDLSSLGILFNTGIIIPILPGNKVSIDEYNFTTIPVNYKKAKEFLKDKKYESNDILLVHHEYETGTNCFNYEDFKNLGCKMIFLGHDHKPFEQGRIIYPEFTIYRSGSLSRNIAIDYNFERTIYYYVIENGNVTCSPIQCSPAQNVFTVEALNRENYKKKKFIESIDTVIEKYKQSMSKTSNMSIIETMRGLGAKDNNIRYIKTKYEIIGETLI